MLTATNSLPASAHESPFVLRMPSVFWWTVRVPLPTDNGYAIGTLELQFKPVSQTRLDAFRGIGLEPDDQVPSDHEICHEVVAGWRNLADEEGVVQRFSPEALNQVLDVPVVRSAIVATYMTAMTGMAARKNA